MKVRAGEGKYLKIKTDHVNDEMHYVKSVRLNGQPYTKAYIRYNDINGAEQNFEMSFKLNKKRIFKEEDRPYSLSRELVFIK